MNVSYQNKEPLNYTELKYPVYIQPFRGIETAYEPGTAIKGFKELNDFNYLFLNGYIHNNKYYIADCLDINDWNKKTNKDTYETRLKRIRGFVNQLQLYHKYIDILTEKVYSTYEIDKLIKRYKEEGYDGIIIRNPEISYIFGEADPKNYYKAYFNDNN